MGSPDIKNKLTWHTETLPSETLRALDLLAGWDWLKKSDWYLAGRIALALYAGHRQSIDLDFFTPRGTFSTGPHLNYFKNTAWKTTVSEKGTIYGTLLQAKVSFISYPFFKRGDMPQWYGNVRVLTPGDIAVMKIIAISQRGRKRDFIDLFWYAQNHEPLITVIKKLPIQYPTVAHNYHHILESMMYFIDAEADPMPTLFFNADWKTVKAYFQKEIPKIAKELLQLE